MRGGSSSDIIRVSRTYHTSIEQGFIMDLSEVYCMTFMFAIFMPLFAPLGKFIN